MKKNLLLLFISTSIVLLLCEITIQIIAPQISEHDVMFQQEEEFGWEFLPNNTASIVYKGGINHTITINEDGFRDSPFKEKNKANTIMVLGDSFVSNIAVKDEAVFTHIMENKLNNTAVYNMGVNGYGQLQEYLILKKWLPQLQPQLAIVVIYLRNDFTDNIGDFPWLYPRPTAVFEKDSVIKIIAPSLDDYAVKEQNPLYYNSHLFLFIKRSIENIKAKSVAKEISTQAPPETNTCRVPLTEATVARYELMQKLILEINTFGQENNTPILFALAPSMFQVEDRLWAQVQDYDPSITVKRDYPNEQLIAFAKAKQLHMIDLMPALKKADQNGIKMYNAHEQHWTTAGNEVVAQALSNYIKQQFSNN